MTTLKRWLTPGFADIILAALISWLFIMSPIGWSLLLSDGDTGWHIRTGEWILANGKVPYQDLFSFSRPGADWYAWEWGSDVLFALLHTWGGLPLLTFVCGFVLILSTVILLRWMVWRGSSILIAFPVMMFATGGSTLHYLARPHVFTLLFLSIQLWLLDSERRNSSWRIWLLVPLTWFWTNLHGGWPALFVFLGIQVGARILYRDPLWRKELLVTLACALATLANPYGWHLHQHIISYLQSSWIRDAVQEFQSPQFRAENLLQFELLLIAGIATAWGRVFRGMAGFTEAVSVWLWAHLSLTSVRHAPLFMIAAAPVISSEVTILIEAAWLNVKKSSIAGIFKSLDYDLRPKFLSTSIWVLALPLIIWVANPKKMPSDFPEKMFPVEATRKLANEFRQARIFTSDQWGDYLLYKLWPHTRVFMDGRSDFFGQNLGRDYLAIANATNTWRKHLDSYRIDLVLTPNAGDLAGRLEQDKEWQMIHSDPVSKAFRRRIPLSPPQHTAQLFSPPD